MAVTASLFFGDALIGTEEAPRRVLEAERFAFNYWAVLKKRFGHITADDFLKYSRRFSVLCGEVYRGSNLELRINKGVPLGFAVLAANLGIWEGVPGEKLDVSQLTVDTFREIFARSSSVTLDIRPIIERDDIRLSFSQIEWTRERPRTIFLYAQDGGRYDQRRDQTGEYHRGPLHDLLLRKMFYVAGTAPSFNFVVKMGVGASIKASEGRMF